MENNKIKNAYKVTKQKLNFASAWLMENVLKKFNFAIFLTLISVSAFILRYYVLDFGSGDYLAFLKPWCDDLKKYPLKAIFKNVPDGYDYTMPYLYVLGIASRFSQAKYIYIIKFVSILFDFICALYIGLICRKIFNKSNGKFLLGYSLTLLLPNVFIDGAVWGQCDVIFTAFIIMAIYYFISGKNGLAMFLYGISFSFKIQAVFFLPVILLLIAKKRVSVFSIVWIFVGMFIINLPAIVLGGGFYGVFVSPYKKQVNGYNNKMVLNGPNLYNLINIMAHYGKYENEINYGYIEWISSLALWLTIGLVMLVFVMALRRKFTFSGKNLVAISYAYAILIPYFLPHMHERYWFFADVLGIAFVICNPKKFYVVLLEWYASARCMLNFIFDTRLTDQQSYIILAIMLLASLILTLYHCYSNFVVTNENEVGVQLVSPCKPQAEVTLTEENSEQGINERFDDQEYDDLEVESEPEFELVSDEKSDQEQILQEENIQE